MMITIVRKLISTIQRHSILSSISRRAVGLTVNTPGQYNATLNRRRQQRLTQWRPLPCLVSITCVCSTLYLVSRHVAISL